MKDCPTCRFSLDFNPFLLGLPADCQGDLPCYTCDGDGSRYERAKSAPKFEDTRGHAGQVTYHRGFDRPGPRTWKIDESWAHERGNAVEASELGGELYAYLNLPIKSRLRVRYSAEFGAIARWCRVFKIRDEELLAVSHVCPLRSSYSEIGRVLGITKQAIHKRMKKVNPHKEKWRRSVWKTH